MELWDYIIKNVDKLNGVTISDNKLNFNMNRIFAETLAKNKNIYSKIDEIFDKENLVIESSYSEESIKSISIEQYKYYKKVTKIMVLSENENKYYKYLLELIKCGWRYVFNYINQNKKVYINKFKDAYFKKFRNSEDAMDVIIVFIIMAKGEKKLVEDDIFREVFSSIIEYSVLKHNDINCFKYENMDSEEVKELEKDKKTIMQKLNISKFSNNTDTFSMYSDINENYGNSPFAVMLETLVNESFSLDDIFNRNLNDKEIIEIINILHVYLDYLNEKNDTWDSIEDINNIIPIMHILVTVKKLILAYEEGRNCFIKNYSEGIGALLEKEREKNTLLNKDLRELEGNEEKLREEIRLLKAENKKLKEEAIDLKRDRPELVSLRNFIFSKSNEDDIKENEITELDIESINAKRGLIVGGSNTWISKMREVLPDWDFIQAGNYNFSKNLLKRNLVIINAGYISHSLYYKVIETNNNVKFINSRNITKVLLELKSLM